MADRTLRAAKTSYIDGLSTRAAYATAAHHKSVIERFVAHCHRKDVYQHEVTTEHAAEFVISEFNPTARSTTQSAVRVLASFLTYLTGSNHPRVRMQLCAALRTREADWSEMDWSPADLQPDISNTLRDAVTVYLDALRQQQYGTRLHAVIEMMIATGSRAKTIRALDRDDVDIDSGKVTLNTPETTAVGACDLVTARTVSLPDTATDPLTTYLRHERVTRSNSTDEPLFTTAHGRVSASTLRRSIRESSRTVLRSSDSNKESEIQYEFEEFEELTLSDIRRYSLTQLAHN